MSGNAPLVIAGGGLAGCLAALALAQRRPDVDFLLLEQAGNFGGNHIWSFFDTDVADEDRWLIDPIVKQRWPDHEIRFPRRQRRIGIGYNSVSSAGLHRQVVSLLKKKQYRTGVRITEVAPTFVTLDNGDRIEGGAVLDARGPFTTPELELGWQKFVGRTYAFAGPHGVERPIIMDATVPQHDGFRFVYSLPFTATEMMMEDTYYSESSALDAKMLSGELDCMARRLDNEPEQLVSEETGILPVLVSGEIDALWPRDEAPVAKIGLRGGYFHPTTGYSLPDAVRTAILLTEQVNMQPSALHAVFGARARQLWKERKFFQLLNRMLFRAAAPDDRYRVLEHFYRLPDAVIGRFYAAKLTPLDKLRILSGRSPVPIRKAAAAMRAVAA